MKYVFYMIMLYSTVIAFEMSVPLSPVGGASTDWLKYDNGTEMWYTREGTYRGVWFNLEDFVPGPQGIAIWETHMWFSHETAHPWDVSEVYLEIWNGNASGPDLLLDRTQVTAVDYAPVGVIFAAPIIAENDFWCIANTELSTEGTPATVSDGAGSSVAHSFYSNDFTSWTPWNPSGFSNYFVGVTGTDPNQALDATTWGSLKATF